MNPILRTTFCILVFIIPTAIDAAEPITPSPELPAGVPWDLKKLSNPPTVEWLDDKSTVRSLLYTGEPFQGKPSRVFAYYATPASIGGSADAKGPWPGVVLVHGGGGTAFSQWVTLWAKRGYAAIAMDLSGMRPETNDPKKRSRLPDGGPDQGHPAKFDTIGTDDVTDDWPYHAVANVILAHSLLRSLPDVDAERTALTGISWGGSTTCLVASLDTRFKAAVPVYGCGFLQENSTWLNEFAKLGPEKTKRWVQLYDPSSYLPACRVPIFFVNGTNDFAYPLDSYMKSYDAVRHASKNIRIQVKMPHGHEVGWAPREIGEYIDSVLLDKPKFPEVEPPQVNDGVVTTKVTSAIPIKSATLEFADQTGPINKLEWKSLPAAIASKAETGLSAALPAGARLYFFTVVTEAGDMVSSPVVIVP